jgi:hypothetical protein
MKIVEQLKSRSIRSRLTHKLATRRVISDFAAKIYTLGTSLKIAYLKFLCILNNV